MQKHERALIDFVRPWLTFGGPPPEDIFVHFGIGPRTFYQRLREVLSGPNNRFLESTLLVEVAELCEDHLAADRDRRDAYSLRRSA